MFTYDVFSMETGRQERVGGVPGAAPPLGSVARSGRPVFYMFSFLNGNLFSISIFLTDSSTVPIPYVPNLGLLLLSIANFDLRSSVRICLVD